MTHVVVVIGGGALSAEAVAAVPEHAVVIAADSGLDHAVAAGCGPTRWSAISTASAPPAGCGPMRTS